MQSEGTSLLGEKSNHEHFFLSYTYLKGCHWLGSIEDGLGRFSFPLWQRPAIFIVQYLILLLAQCSNSLQIRTPLSSEKRSINPRDNQNDSQGWIKLLCLLTKYSCLSCADSFIVQAPAMSDLSCFAHLTGACSLFMLPRVALDFSLHKDIFINTKIKIFLIAVDQ